MGTARAEALRALLTLADTFLARLSETSPEQLMARLEDYVSERGTLFEVLREDERGLSGEEEALMRALLERDAGVDAHLLETRRAWGSDLGEVKSRTRDLNGYRAPSGARRTFHIKG